MANTKHSGLPAWNETDLPGSGPVVVAASTRARPLTDQLTEYADGVGARRTLDLHVPGELDPAGIRALARHIATTLGDVADQRQGKHLLLAGPAALATLVGAGANAAGPIVMPLWADGGYAPPIVLRP